LSNVLAVGKNVAL